MSANRIFSIFNYCTSPRPENKNYPINNPQDSDSESVVTELSDLEGYKRERKNLSDEEKPKARPKKKKKKFKKKSTELTILASPRDEQVSPLSQDSTPLTLLSETTSPTLNSPTQATTTDIKSVGPDLSHTISMESLAPPPIVLNNDRKKPDSVCDQFSTWVVYFSLKFATPIRITGAALGGLMAYFSTTNLMVLVSAVASDTEMNNRDPAVITGGTIASTIQTIFSWVGIGEGLQYQAINKGKMDNLEKAVMTLTGNQTILAKALDNERKKNHNRERDLRNRVRKLEAQDVKQTERIKQLEAQLAFAQGAASPEKKFNPFQTARRRFSTFRASSPPALPPPLERTGGYQKLPSPTPESPSPEGAPDPATQPSPQPTPFSPRR